MINWWERRTGERNIIDNIESIAHRWQVTNGEPWVYQVLVIAWLEYVSWKAVQLHASICYASQSRIVFYPFPLLPSFWKLISSFTKMGMQQNLKIIRALYRAVKYSWVNLPFSGIGFPSFHGTCSYSPEQKVTFLSFLPSSPSSCQGLVLSDVVAVLCGL